MALLDGKQLRDDSLSLDKLSGTTGLVTFTSSATMSFEAGTSLKTADSNILLGTDVVNKNYVDAVASGLDPKESVRFASTADVGGTYADNGGVGDTITVTSFTVPGLDDGGTAANGDRILIKNQTDPKQNGIYTLSGQGVNPSVLTRAVDQDGSPANEVSSGNFTFVETGNTLGGTGWVVIGDGILTLNTDDIDWVQFSDATALTAGDGLTQTGNTLDVGAGTGLSASSTEVFIENTTVTGGNYGADDTVPTFTVNAQGQLTAATDILIDITSGQVNNFTASSETVIFTDANFVDGTTVQFDVTAGDSTIAEVVTGSLTASKLNSNGQGATAGYILSANSDGTFAWILNDQGDITDITAGAGLTGGGTTGAITIDARAENGLQIDGTSDAVELGGALTKNTIINGGSEYNLNLGGSSGNRLNKLTTSAEQTNIFSTATFSLIFGSLAGDVTGTIQDDSSNKYGLIYADDYSATFASQSLITKQYVDDAVAASTTGVSEVNAGDGLVQNGPTGSVTLDVVGGTGINANANDANDIEIDFTQVATGLQGNGLTANSGVLDVNVGDGLVINSDVVEANVADGLTINDSSQIGVSATIAGDGLTFSAGVLDVNTSNGISISGDDVVLGGAINTVTNLTIGTGGSLTFTDNRSTTIGVEYAADYSTDFTDRSLVDKAYVDSVAQGLIIHDPVEVGTLDSLQNTFGTTFTYNNGTVGVGSTLTSDTNIHLNSTGIDGLTTVLVGDSVLVKNEATDAYNGIYIITDLGATGSSPIIFTRRTDFDSPPGASDGIHDGDFTFIGQGTSQADTGWVQTETWGTASVVGTTPINFVQFSSAGVIQAGGGLSQTGQIFNVGAGAGITVSTNDVAVDFTEVAETLQGAGLTANAGVVNVGAGTGITVNADDVAVDFTEVADLLQGQGLTSNSGVINVDLTSNGGLTFSGAGDTGTLQVEVDNSTITIVNGQLVASAQGDITGVTAGNGLSGGGTTGFVTLDVNLGIDGGLTFSGDDIVVDEANFDYTILNTNLQGNGLTANAGVLDVNTGNGLTINSDVVEADLLIDGGLTFSSGQIEVSVDNTTIQIVNGELVATTLGDIQGVTAGAGLIGGGDSGFLQMDVEITAQGGLTFSAAGDGGTLEVETDGTTIQVNASGQLEVLNTGGQPVYTQMAETSVTTSPNTDNVSTTIAIDSTPSDYSRIQIFVNGQLQNLGDGVTTTDCYFRDSSNTTTRGINEIVATDVLYWNGAIAGFRLTTSDVISISYEV
jgi:hypothetical protein